MGRSEVKSTDPHGHTRTPDKGLIPRFGGYRNTKTFLLAELIYDITVRFCDKFVDRRNRTHDQMVQAARSGSRNLSEGSMDSATSKKIEMKLTGVALGSLDELRRDYVAFLRHRGLPEWPPEHPALMRLKARRCATLEEFRAWVADEVRRARQENLEGQEGQGNTDRHGQTQTETGGAGGDQASRHSPCAVRVGPCESVSSPAASSPPVSPQNLPAVLAANGALCLLNLCIYLVKRQLEAQAAAFERDGGFTERLYRRRRERRQMGND